MPPPLPDWGHDGGDDEEEEEDMLFELRRHCARLEAEVKVQSVATLKAQEAARRYRMQAESLESEIRAAEQQSRDEGREAEAGAVTLAESQAATAALLEEKRALLKRIKAEKLTLGTKQAESCTVSDVASTVVTRVVSSAKRTQSLKRTIRELGDANAILSQEAAAERDRRHRAREAVCSELAAQEAEREELKSSLVRLGEEAVRLKERFAEANGQEHRDREEANELRERAAKLRAESPRFHDEREEFIRLIREVSVADVELRQNLKVAQDRLWEREALERDRK